MWFSKAQMTVFMIIGILVIASFAFILQQKGQIEEKRMRAYVDKIVSDILSTEAINYYVDLCLEKSSQEGLKLIGSQGGYILIGQPGSIINYSDTTGLPNELEPLQFSVEGKDYNLVPLIFSNVGVVGGRLPPPIYPCLTGDFPPKYCEFIYEQQMDQSLKFGTYILPPLKREDEGYGIFSIQEQLESFIVNKTKSCIEFETIQALNETFTFDKGNMSAEIKITDNNLITTLDFPLIISLQGNLKFSSF